jgi:ABC-type nitrate/sulfonate/bicarbonate transport system substrate-binding protein
VRKIRFVALLAVLALLLAACGGGGEEGTAGGGEAGGDGELELNQVRLAIDNDDFMNSLSWIVADERYWPELGFTEPAEVVATDEYIAGLVGGDVWVVQGESDAIWAALAEGSVPMTIIGVEKSEEAFFLGIREGVDPEALEGLKISGGTIGDRNVTVGENILTDLGVDPESMEWVAIEGGSDDRLQALLAGQIDVAVLQPRHIIPLEEGGGQMIYQEYRESPQEVWVTRAETVEENQEAVCAYLEGRIAARQWFSEGDDYAANQDEAVSIAQERGLEPEEGDLAEWQAEMEHNLALDGGASVESFDQWNEDMIANGNVPEGFDWREHVDFTCLWQVQENLGLEQNPNPDEL